jgi:hypothetical protein
MTQMVLLLYYVQQHCERCKMFNRLLGRLAVKYPKLFGRFVRFNPKDI